MADQKNVEAIGLYPTLQVPDVTKAIEYYQQKLGFDLQFLWGEPPVHAGVNFGSVTFHFSEGTSNPDGFWLYLHVENLIDLYEMFRDNEVELLGEPEQMEWGMQEFNMKDLNGYRLRFGQSNPRHGDPVPVERVDVDVRLEKRLASLLADLAVHKEMSIAETLEETLLHSFEAMPNFEGQGVASPHTRRTLREIERLKQKHGIDYETHDSYRFRESDSQTGHN